MHFDQLLPAAKLGLIEQINGDEKIINAMLYFYGIQNLIVPGREQGVDRYAGYIVSPHMYSFTAVFRFLASL